MESGAVPFDKCRFAAQLLTPKGQHQRLVPLTTMMFRQSEREIAAAAFRVTSPPFFLAWAVRMRSVGPGRLINSHNLFLL
jgi:hypothetical protein